MRAQQGRGLRGPCCWETGYVDTGPGPWVDQTLNSCPEAPPLVSARLVTVPLSGLPPRPDRPENAGSAPPLLLTAAPRSQQGRSPGESSPSAASPARGGRPA